MKDSNKLTVQKSDLKVSWPATNCPALTAYLFAAIPGEPIDATS